MSAHVQQASILSGRSMTFMVVVGLHALFIAALVAIRIVPPLLNNGPAPFEVVNVPPEVVPPPPQPTPKVASTPKIQVVVPIFDPPEFVVPLEAEAVKAPAPDSGPVQVVPAPSSVTEITAPPAHVFTDLDYRAIRSPDEYYPATSVALQEQGVAIVQVCVDGRGRIDGQPTIQTSSGSRRLDQAAVKWVREALRFTPATENGVGVRSCKGFRVVFNLN